VSSQQADSWGSVSWCGWEAFDRTVSEDRIPASGGIYRFRNRGEPGLLYIGEGSDRRRRLQTLEKYSKAHPARYYLEWPAGDPRPFRGHYAAPFLRLCRDIGCVVEVSWTIDVHAEPGSRKALETSLIRQYYDEAHSYPPWQFGGRAMAAYLVERQLGEVSAPDLGRGFANSRCEITVSGR
jgi:hypothetical protein